MGRSGASRISLGLAPRAPRPPARSLSWLGAVFAATCGILISTVAHGIFNAAWERLALVCVLLKK